MAQVCDKKASLKLFKNRFYGENPFFSCGLGKSGIKLVWYKIAA